MSADSVIDVRKLAKTFGKFQALDGLDLSVKRGHIHGFLGPNGAGKSTTIRVLLGCSKQIRVMLQSSGQTRGKKS